MAARVQTDGKGHGRRVVILACDPRLSERDGHARSLAAPNVPPGSLDSVRAPDDKNPAETETNADRITRVA
jgi:hypothetical protein